MEQLGNALPPTLGAERGLLAAAPPVGARILSQKKLWEGAGYNAFTDLVYHRGRWLCCLREASSHTEFDGQIRVLTSVDAVSWTSAALLTGVAGEDLRDPHFLQRPDGVLLLLSGTRTTDGVTAHIRSRIWASGDGLTWGTRTDVADLDAWLWRATWRGDTAYSIAYSTDASDFLLRLYTGHTGTSWSAQTTVLSGAPVGTYGYPNETDLLFLADGTAVALTRRDSGGQGFSTTALLSTASPPYQIWTTRTLDRRLGSPRLLALPDGRIVVAARFYSPTRVSLGWLDIGAGSVTEIITLATDSDCGYPGAVLSLESGRAIWVSYYSSHDTKASVYLAQVKLAPIGGLV